MSACPTRSDAASISSIVAAPVSTSAGSAAVAALEVGKTSRPVARVLEQRDRAEHRLGDEGQRALAADDQVGQHVDRAAVKSSKAFSP